MLAVGLSFLLLASIVSMPISMYRIQSAAAFPSVTGLPAELLSEALTELQLDKHPLAQNSGSSFVANEGQLDAEVSYYMDIFAGTVYVTSNGLTYALDKASGNAIDESPSIAGVAIKESFVDSNQLYPQGQEQTATKINHFVGDQSDWKTNIQTFNKISLGHVWNGIDVQLVSANNNVEKIFTVAPGADVRDIQIALSGVTDMSVNNLGELVLGTQLGEISLTKPVAFQENGIARTPVEVAYVIEDNAKYSFAVGDSYDPSYPLIIDPLLASTYIGGADNEGNSLLTPLADDEDMGIAFDSLGNVFIAGLTSGTADDYPATVGPYGSPSGVLPDVVVSKFNSDLSLLLASAVIGGSELDEALAIAMDSAGNPYITGRTNSTNFPITSDGNGTYGGGLSDVFVSALSNDLGTLEYSTYIGGSDMDEAHAIAINATGAVYVVGTSRSANYPTTPGAYDPVKNGGVNNNNVIVTSLNGATITGSTFLGGSNDGVGRGIAISSSGNIYVTGNTRASNFPMVGGYDTTKVFGVNQQETFVAAFDSGLTDLLASTYHGGGATSGEHTAPFGIALDLADNVYIAGYTHSAGFPTTTGAYDETYEVGADDAYISVLTPSLDDLTASTVIGGASNERIRGLALTSSSVYVIANGGSYPTTPGAFNEGANDAYISRVSLDLSALIASTSIGGSNTDALSAIGISSGDVYVAGWTRSINFPTTAGAHDTIKAGVPGSFDFFVSKLTADLSAPSAAGAIAFESDRDGNYEIYVMKADGASQTRLTNNASSDLHPSFSPDGAQIAFQGNRDGNGEIYVMNADGTGETRLTNNFASDGYDNDHPDFSPDGTLIVFDRDEIDEIYVMNADGTGETRLTNNVFFDSNPSFSPDGTKIAFDSHRGGNPDIYVMNADGTGETRLTNSVFFDGYPSFSPDGTKIAFVSDRDGNLEIYVMNADGTGETRRTNNAAADGYPSFSPDGTLIAFESDRDGNLEIYLMNADGTNPSRRTNNAAFDAAPDFGLLFTDTTPPIISSISDSPDPFSPNGDTVEDTTTVSFTSNEAGTFTLQILDASLMGGQNITGPMFAGVNDVDWDGSGFSSATVPDGVYQYLIEADDLSGNRAIAGLPIGTHTVTVDTATPVGPDVTIILVSNPSPIWGLDTVDLDFSFAGAIPGDCVFVSWGDTTSSFMTVTGTGSGTLGGHVYDSANAGPKTITAQLINPCSFPTTLKDTDTAAITVQAHATMLELNDLRDVTATTGFTAGGRLVDTEYFPSREVSGQTISFTGSGATASLQDVMTDGVDFTGAGITINSCLIPGSCVLDDIGNDSDPASNMVLHLPVGGNITFPEGTVNVKLWIQDMGTTSFKFVVEEGGGIFQPEATSNGILAPNVNVLQIYSGTSLAGMRNGIKMITIKEVGGSTSTGYVGIAAVLTGNPDGLPNEQHEINFEEFSAGAQSNPFTVNGGHYYSTGSAQNIDAVLLDVTADFTGNAAYQQSSDTKSYNVLANTQGIGGEGSQATGGNTGGSITRVDCSSATDSDNDGICDIWETSGIPSGSATYRLDNSNPNVAGNLDGIATVGVKDIFVEVDCMLVSGGGNYCPTSADITAIKSAFSSKGYTLHIVVSDSSIALVDPMNVWISNDGNNANDFDNLKKDYFGTANDRDRAVGTVGDGQSGSLRAGSDYLVAKAMVFHYGLFVKNIGSTACSGNGISGQAELNGNDFIVSVGCGFTGTVGSDQERRGTFMHELGHNLGLRHGGGDDDNCKPNLISVMNYNRQMPWAQLTATTTSGAPTEWALTYSRQDMIDLNENNGLLEASGLPITTSLWGPALASGSTSFKIIWGKPGASPSILTGSTGASVNWNNAAGTGPYTQDINKLTGVTGCSPGTTSNTNLASYDEWSLITQDTLNFRDSSTIDGVEYPDPDTVTELTPIVLEGAKTESAVGPINISTNTGLSVTPDVAVDDSNNDGNNDVYAVWSDTTGGTSRSFDILFKKSTDGGATFGPVTNISTNAGTSLTPRIAVSGNSVYVIWSDTTGGTSGKFDILFRRSLDGGANWDPIKNISTNTGDSLTPHLATDGANVYTIWSDKTDGVSSKFDILFKKSTNSGGTFSSTATKLSNNAGESLTPAVGVSGSTVYAVWSDTTGGTSGSFDILVKKSTNSGGSFDASATNISSNSGASLTPYVAVDPLGVYVVWSDTTGGTSGKFDILMKNAPLAGTFGPVKNISTTAGDSLTPRVAASGASVFVAWSDTTGGTSGSFDILAKRSNDAGSSFGAANNMSVDSGFSATPALAIDSPYVYLAWGDLSSGQLEIKYASRII